MWGGLKRENVENGQERRERRERRRSEDGENRDTVVNATSAYPIMVAYTRWERGADRRPLKFRTVGMIPIRTTLPGEDQAIIGRF